MQSVVSIPGIHCASCAGLIKDVSEDFPAITNVEVDLETKKVTLDHDESFDMSKWSAEIQSLDPKYTIHFTPAS